MNQNSRSSRFDSCHDCTFLFTGYKVNLVVVPENFSGAVPSEIPASVSVVHPDFIRESGTSKSNSKGTALFTVLIVAKKQRLDESSYYGNKKEVKVDPECLPEAANVEEPEVRFPSFNSAHFQKSPPKRSRKQVAVSFGMLLNLLEPISILMSQGITNRI